MDRREFLKNAGGFLGAIGLGCLLGRTEDPWAKYGGKFVRFGHRGGKTIVDPQRWIGGFDKAVEGKDFTAVRVDGAWCGPVLRVPKLNPPTLNELAKVFRCYRDVHTAELWPGDFLKIRDQLIEHVWSKPMTPEEELQPVTYSGVLLIPYHYEYRGMRRVRDFDNKVLAEGEDAGPLGGIEQ